MSVESCAAVGCPVCRDALAAAERKNVDLIDGMRMMTAALAELSRRLPESDPVVAQRVEGLQLEVRRAVEARLGAEAKVRELEEMVSVLQYEKQTAALDHEHELQGENKHLRDEIKRLEDRLGTYRATADHDRACMQRAQQVARDANEAMDAMRNGQAAGVAGFVHERQRLVAWTKRWRAAAAKWRPIGKRYEAEMSRLKHERDLLKAELARACTKLYGEHWGQTFQVKGD